MVGGASGGVHVLSPVPSQARLRASTPQSLTTRLMGGAGGNDSSRTIPVVNGHHDSGAPFHEPPHIVNSTTVEEDPCLMEGDESQPQEGWVIRHHQQPSAPQGVRGCEVSTIHASWLLYPTGNGCRGSPEI